MVSKENQKNITRLFNQIDKRIKTLVVSRRNLENTKRPNNSSREIYDFEKLDVSEELSRLKAIQREKLLEDLSLILNDKITELELRENELNQKEKLITNMTSSFNKKIKKIKLGNTKLLEQKKYSDELNAKLKKIIKKLRDQEVKIMAEKNWMAYQLDKKSEEVLLTVNKLIKAENT